MLRVSHIDSGIGPAVPIAIIADLLQKRATHASFHANKIRTLYFNVSPQYHSKNREEEEVRKGSCLEHLLDLDLSSNCLHEGYSLPQFGGQNKMSLLGLCVNLCRLNLSSNGLTSFGVLVAESVEKPPCLPRLQTLDISNNNFSKLPLDLHAICPALKYLAATNNNIKSLKTLCTALHKLRGKVERLGLSNNPVCSRELYREKIIYVLGPKLSQFDNSKINTNEREKAWLKLERGLSKVTVEQECTQHTSQDGKTNQQTYYGHTECNQNAVEVPSVEPRQSLRNNTADEKIKTLEEQIAFLSAAIEKQVTNNTAQSDDNRGSVDQKQDNLRNGNQDAPIKPSRAKVLESKLEAMCRRQKAAAIYLLKTILTRKKQKRTNSLLAFSLWASKNALKTQLIRHAKQSKAMCIESERKWQIKATELVNKAVNEEIEEGKRRLNLSQSSKEETMKLAREEVKTLEQQLEHERGRRILAENASREAKDALKTNTHQLEAMRMDSEKQKECAQIAKVEEERLRKELLCTNEAFAREQSARTKLESEMSTANQDSKELVTTHASQLHAVKLKVRQKDEIIQRLKDSYEQAARRSAADRSRYEQALTAEQQAKGLIRNQTTQLHNIEAEMQRLIAENKSRQFTVQNSNASKVSHLSSEVEDKDRKIRASERRIKSILEECNDIHQQLTRKEAENSQLQSRLDSAHDDIRKAKREKERLDADISRTMDLEQSLDRLRQSTHQQELELQTRIKMMHKENIMLREDMAKNEKLTTDLGRTVQMSKNDARQLQTLIDEQKQELESMSNDFQAERAIRLDIEKKAAALGVENEKQKFKMKTAIESLAKQLAGTS